jgi:ABC-2 type transport system ATP-binding protein
MPETVLEVSRLCKTFRGPPAVDDVSLSLARGEILGLLGPNGAGKTTILHMLLGLITPTSGRIAMFGMDLDAHRLDILARVNFTSAYISMPTNLRVWENLEVFARLYGVRRRRQRIDETLELLEIPQVKNRTTGELSSGQITRLNLCKALIPEPEILFLDEPTSSLDPDIASKVRRVLRRIRDEKGVSMVYTSHNMREVEQMCDRVVFLAKGEKIMEGTPEELRRSSRSASLEDLFLTIARDGRVVHAEETDHG